jgi:hypothetical protein
MGPFVQGAYSGCRTASPIARAKAKKDIFSSNLKVGF